MTTTPATQIDTPDALILTDLERNILDRLASAEAPKDIAISLGIPRTSISNLLRKPGVKDFIQELVDARNQVMKMYLPDLLMGIIEDKIAKNQEDDESRLSDLTKKDVVDIAKQLDSLLKTTDTVQKTEGEDKMSKLYQQINIIQNGE
jgi:hypothetical protein